MALNYQNVQAATTGRLQIGKGGLHRNGWNPEWADYIGNNPNATAQDVLDQLEKMKNEWHFQKPLSSCD